MEGYSDSGGDRRQEALIGVCKATFLVRRLDADDSNHLAAGWNRDPEVRSSHLSDLLDAQLLSIAFHILVDQQGLASPDDLGRES